MYRKRNEICFIHKNREKKPAIRSQFNIVILNDVVWNYIKCHQGHATLVGRMERSNNTKAILNSCLWITMCNKICNTDKLLIHIPTNDSGIQLPNCRPWIDFGKYSWSGYSGAASFLEIFEIWPITETFWGHIYEMGTRAYSKVIIKYVTPLTYDSIT